MAGYQTVAQRNLTCAIRIKERRKQLGLTQAEVVDRVSRHGSRLSNQALSAIENGRRLAVGRLPDLAAALDCTITYLIGLTADPRRWAALMETIEALINEDFRDRVEPFDGLAAEQYATVVGREKKGRPISAADAQIAAICRVHSATLATRNTGDFTDTGIDLINPWDTGR